MKIKYVIIGQQVVRSKGDYVVGRIGTVIDKNEQTNRVQVDWHGYTKTWVSAESIESSQTPYIIEPAKYDNDGRRISWPIYKII